MSRTSRLLEMLGLLRTRRTPATALELAQELGVSERSVYRDVETLRLLGAPLDGQAGVGFLLRDGFFLPNFAFSDDELEALVLGLTWVQQRADPMSQGSESALAKILSSRGGQYLTTDAQAPALVSAASISERSDPAHVATLRDAIRRLRKVAITMKMVTARFRNEPSGRSQSSTSTTCASLPPGAKEGRPFVISASTVSGPRRSSTTGIRNDGRCSCGAGASKIGNGVRS
ncbi:putative transcriptional regulator [Rhizobium leguminosarum bv. trifolii WSM2012]|nr:putative transcriptional regulator [Rhizobium leguminosarum bv. trifolii WSM2012]